jgi:hypothetical protein
MAEVNVQESPGDRGEGHHHRLAFSSSSCPCLSVLWTVGQYSTAVGELPFFLNQLRRARMLAVATPMLVSA